MIARWISFLLFILAGWLLKRLFFPTHGTRRRTAAKRPPESAEMMVRDPVCKAFITREDAVALERSGERLFFCSERCRAAFLSRG